MLSRLYRAPEETAGGGAWVDIIINKCQRMFRHCHSIKQYQVNAQLRLELRGERERKRERERERERERVVNITTPCVGTPFVKEHHQLGRINSDITV